MTRAVSGSRFASDLIRPILLAQSKGPAAEWSFNEVNGQVAHDSISGRDDAIGGLFKWVNGVTGNGLRFDGESTVIVRGHKGAPQTTAGVTVDAWVAVNTYPWNWVPIVEHRREEQAGYFFGIDCFGHIGLKVAVNGQWWSLVSTSQLPSKEVVARGWHLRSSKGNGNLPGWKACWTDASAGNAQPGRPGRFGYRQNSRSDSSCTMDSS